MKEILLLFLCTTLAVISSFFYVNSKYSTTDLNLVVVKYNENKLKDIENSILAKVEDRVIDLKKTITRLTEEKEKSKTVELKETDFSSLYYEKINDQNVVYKKIGLDIRDYTTKELNELFYNTKELNDTLSTFRYILINRKTTTEFNNELINIKRYNKDIMIVYNVDKEDLVDRLVVLPYVTYYMIGDSVNLRKSSMTIKEIVNVIKTLRRELIELDLYEKRFIVIGSLVSKEDYLVNEKTISDYYRTLLLKYNLYSFYDDITLDIKVDNGNMDKINSEMTYAKERKLGKRTMITNYDSLNRETFINLIRSNFVKTVFFKHSNGLYKLFKK